MPVNITSRHHQCPPDLSVASEIPSQSHPYHKTGDLKGVLIALRLAVLLCLHFDRANNFLQGRLGEGGGKLHQGIHHHNNPQLARQPHEQKQRLTVTASPEPSKARRLPKRPSQPLLLLIAAAMG